MVRPQANGLRPRLIGLRFGGLMPSDGGLERFSGDIETFGLTLRNRLWGPEGHLSVEAGVEYWQTHWTMGGNPLFSWSFDIEEWSVPLTIGYNTSSLAAWSEEKVNVFVGAGISLSSIYQRQQTPVRPTSRKYDAGYGLHLQASVDVPLFETFFASAVVRYRWSESFDHDALPPFIDDLGGWFVGADFGVRF